MRMKEITITASRTINLGDFNSIRVEGSSTVEIEDGDDIEEAREWAVTEVKAHMREMHQSLQKKKT